MSQYLANGICSAAIFGLVGVGFALIFSTTKIFHIAHGAIFTLSAYACYVAVALWSLPIYLGIFIAILVGSAAGLIIELLVYFPLVDPYKKRQATSTVLIISSLGTYIVLVNVLAICFGEETKFIRSGAESTFDVFGARITLVQAWQLLALVAVIPILWFYFFRSRLGILTRALADDPVLLDVLGQNIYWIRYSIFLLGSGLGGLAGALSALDIGVDPHVGFRAVLIGSVAAIVGGTEKFLAPFAGAFVVCIAQSLVVSQTSAKWADAVVFGILIVILLAKPQGIFGVKLRLEEK